MKALAFASLLVAPLAVAQPHHQHRHQHAHPKRVPEVTEVVQGGETVVLAYELNGQSISSDDVCSGIAAGSLKWADGVAPPGACQSSTPATSPASSPASSPAPSQTPSSSSTAPAEFYQQSSSSSSYVAPSSTAASSPSPSPSQSSSDNSSSNSGGSSNISGGNGVDKPFPSGEHDCDYFPSDYGAVAIPYLGLSNWIGFQDVQTQDGAFNNIESVTSGDCSKEGRYCQYACPAGTLQRQWPSTQGLTGQSVGGIQCRGGKLHLTNENFNTLCSSGVGNVQVQNNAGQVLSLCRTSYPGKEDETIPLEVQAGNQGQVACPDASNFYQWKGMSTSAQYYLNPPGVPASEGCRWGDPSKNIGNYAPVNFGVGKKDGKFWLSIMNNEPTTSATFSGKIEIKGSDVVGDCRYDNGQFSGSGATGNGCTISSESGDVTYVVST